MSRKKSPPLPPAVTELRKKIAHWRETREKLSPMPSALWAEAVRLAQFAGTAPIARAAGLDYSNLKKRVGKAEQAAASRPQPAAAGANAFVEVTASAASVTAEPAETTVELSSKDGSRMVIRLKGRCGVELEQLMTAFWRRES